MISAASCEPERWYDHLERSKRRGLLDWVHEYQIANGIIVLSIESLNDGGERRQFGFYPAEDYLKLMELIETIRPNFTLHEVPLGRTLQKFRADINIDNEKLPAGLIEAELEPALDELSQRAIDVVISSFFRMANVPFNSDLIHLSTSHGRRKRSVHLVMNGYIFATASHAKAFFNKMVKSDPALSDLVARGIVNEQIYNADHSLRLLGSRKQGRVKEYQPSFIYDGVQYAAPVRPGNPKMIQRAIFFDSLISWCHDSEATLVA